jgi:hypothetical protein
MSIKARVYADYQGYFLSINGDSPGGTFQRSSVGFVVGFTDQNVVEFYCFKSGVGSHRVAFPAGNKNRENTYEAAFSATTGLLRTYLNGELVDTTVTTPLQTNTLTVDFASNGMHIGTHKDNEFYVRGRYDNIQLTKNGVVVYNADFNNGALSGGSGAVGYDIQLMRGALIFPAVASGSGPTPVPAWMPATLGNDLAAWYAPDAGEYAIVDGNEHLVRWLDKSSNMRHTLAQNTPTKGPVRLPNGSLKYEASRTAGNNNTITVSAAILSLPQPFSITIRAKIYGNADSPAATDYLLDGYDGSRTLITNSGNGTDDTEFAFGLSSSFSFPVIIERETWKNKWHTYTIIADGSNSRVYLDSTLISTDNWGANPLQGLRFGCSQNGQHGLNGELSEAFISSRALTEDECLKADNYLKSIWR